MGEHAYDHSSMSPSMPPAQPRGSSRHHTTSSSRTTTTRPAIRIIHIIAPEIIKTDAANFRDLVQRLTGRQHQQLSDDESSAAVTVAVAPTPPSPIEEKPQKKRLAPAPALADDFVLQQENRGRKKIKCEVVKVEEGEFGFGSDHDFGELWMDHNPGGFLSFLEDEVFQGTMAPEFLQPPPGLGSSRMDWIGEMCAPYLA
ncbi:hypothetical protein QYE76_037605 [Lolium multiflorum]|uniref:VQ domain-containing protein n=1 Tax=Lolium multiflorum TaxID=4521 RepID=A0AAD8QKS2_LOLMU|nr:hypothetical protein QYE76_037605 [Lolium multiflorum]